MGRQTKIWLWIAVSLLITGCLIIGGVMTMLNWDFSKLSTTQYETSNYTISQSYKSIQLVTDTADVVFVPAKSSETTVACREQRNIRHTVTVENDTLTIQVKDTRKWYEHIGIHFGTNKITVTLPQTQYAGLNIQASTGNIRIPSGFGFENANITASTGDIDVKNITADSLNLSVTTGKITLSGAVCKDDVAVQVSTGYASIADVECKTLLSSGSTGSLLLKNVVATEKFTIERDTGDVKFDGCDAGEIFVETDTGDVTGTLLSEKIFFAQTDTGRVDVPKSTAGGKCEITTDTGDIRITTK